MRAFLLGIVASLYCCGSCIAGEWITLECKISEQFSGGDESFPFVMKININVEEKLYHEHGSADSYKIQSMDNEYIHLERDAYRGVILWKKIHRVSLSFEAYRSHGEVRRRWKGSCKVIPLEAPARRRL